MFISFTTLGTFKLIIRCMNLLMLIVAPAGFLILQVIIQVASIYEQNLKHTSDFGTI